MCDRAHNLSLGVFFVICVLYNDPRSVKPVFIVFTHQILTQCQIYTLSKFYEVNMLGVAILCVGCFLAFTLPLAALFAKEGATDYSKKLCESVFYYTKIIFVAGLASGATWLLLESIEVQLYSYSIARELSLLALIPILLACILFVRASHIIQLRNILFGSAANKKRGDSELKPSEANSQDNAN